MTFRNTKFYFLSFPDSIPPPPNDSQNIVFEIIQNYLGICRYLFTRLINFSLIGILVKTKRLDLLFFFPKALSSPRKAWNFLAILLAAGSGRKLFILHDLLNQLFIVLPMIRRNPFSRSFTKQNCDVISLALLVVNVPSFTGRCLLRRLIVLLLKW